MATDATGTPTPLGIPKFDVANDAPSGLGSNAQMDAIDTLISARIEKPASPSVGDSLVWDGSDWVPGDGGTPSVTPVQLLSPLDGNSFWTVTNLTGWIPGNWQFVNDVNGFIYGQVLVPEGLTDANVRAVIAANATSGVTRMNMGYVAIGDGEALNPASLPQGTAQDVPVPSTAYLRKDVLFPVTGITGGDLLAVVFFHEGSHVNDTLAVNTLLFGAWLEPA